jgi:hypothetical protein
MWVGASAPTLWRCQAWSESVGAEAPTHMMFFVCREQDECYVPFPSTWMRSRGGGPQVISVHLPLAG